MKGEGVRERVREGVKQRGGEGAWEGVVHVRCTCMNSWSLRGPPRDILPSLLLGPSFPSLLLSISDLLTLKSPVLPS